VHKYIRFFLFAIGFQRSAYSFLKRRYFSNSLAKGNDRSMLNTEHDQTWSETMFDQFLRIATSDR